jgi:hypothetical protein
MRASSRVMFAARGFHTQRRPWSNSVRLRLYWQVETLKFEMRVCQLMLPPIWFTG